MSRPLAVASLNIHGLPLTRPSAGRRATRVARFADAAGIDVLHVQEAHTRAVRAALAAGLPSLPHVSWQPGPTGPAGGLVTFSRRPATSVSFRPFPGRHRRRAEPRRALRGERRKGMLVTSVAGDTFVNVHLSPNRHGDWSPGSRLAGLHRVQLDAVAELAAELAGDGLIVVSGDFNVAKDSGFYREFVARSGLADAFGDRAPVTFHPELLPPGRQSRCIDHLLFRGGQGEVRVTASDLIFREKETLDGGRQAFLSDHAGLLVRLEL